MTLDRNFTPQDPPYSPTPSFTPKTTFNRRARKRHVYYIIFASNRYQILEKYLDVN